MSAKTASRISNPGNGGPTQRRKLSEVLKCTQCRDDKQKCKPQRRIWPQRCDRCISFNHECSPGTPSKKGQKQLSRRPKLLNEQASASARSDSTSIVKQEYISNNSGVDYPPSSNVTVNYNVSFNLNIVEPSNPRTVNRMTYHMDKRLQGLWGNYNAFARAKLSHVFCQTVSTFFAIEARQMAQNYPMVWEALYACGAADALMNSKLPAAIRNEYQLAYCIHYARGIKLINEAIAQHNEDLRTGREPDVLPLYHAVWLLHSSGACAKGNIDDIQAALNILKYLDKYTDRFPLGIGLIETQTGVNKGWTVRMVLAHHPEDKGMEITRARFPLGRARVEYDQNASTHQT